MAEPRTGRMWSYAIALAILGLLVLTAVLLSTAVRPVDDRIQEISARLRCPVCKSVSIAESPSDTATAMRQVIAEQVATGRTDEEILDFFRGRYGDWVLSDPPPRGTTLPLWLLPLVAAVLGAVLVLSCIRRRTQAPLTELTDAERTRVDAAVARARAAHGNAEETL